MLPRGSWLSSYGKYVDRFRKKEKEDQSESGGRERQVESNSSLNEDSPGKRAASKENGKLRATEDRVRNVEDFEGGGRYLGFLVKWKNF